MALPPGLPQMPGIDVVTGAAVVFGSMSAHKPRCFPLVRDHSLLTPRAQNSFSEAVVCFVLGSLRNCLGLSPGRLYQLSSYVSGVFYLRC